MPRAPSPSAGTSQSKLLGHCVWPLSIPLPKTAVCSNGTGDMQAFRLPETFLERHTSASVQYDFTILISRGKLRSDSQYVELLLPEDLIDIFGTESRQLLAMSPPPYLNYLRCFDNLLINKPTLYLAPIMTRKVGKSCGPSLLVVLCTRAVEWKSIVQ